ncbi:alcohol dehydrogenase catalytic domain-containing protein [Sorangium sp. So ce269]
MRATIMYGAGDVRVVNVPDPTIAEPTDAIVRVVRACICGSDLWPYRDMAPSETGQSMGHEAIGVVEAVGRDVGGVRPGQVIVMPFAISDGTCEPGRVFDQTVGLDGVPDGYRAMDQRKSIKVLVTP